MKTTQARYEVGCAVCGAVMHETNRERADDAAVRHDRSHSGEASATVYDRMAHHGAPELWRVQHDGGLRIVRYRH